MAADLTSLSRRLAYVLRHGPESIGGRMSPEGWMDVATVLQGLGSPVGPLPRAVLDEIVDTDGKGRYEYDPEGVRIRARQGHSVPVELRLEPVAPPPLLFHGTTRRFVGRILAEGLRPMNRHHVHLSGDRPTARVVGARRGQPVVLQVDAVTMAEAGHAFYRTSNGVWLAESVPPVYLTIEA